MKQGEWNPAALGPYSVLGAGKHLGGRKDFPKLLLEESDFDRTELRSKGIVNRGAESVRRVTLGKVHGGWGQGEARSCWDKEGIKDGVRQLSEK